MYAKNVQKKIILETEEKLKSIENVFCNNKKNNIESPKHYVKNRFKTDVNFCLIVYSRKRIFKSLKGMAKQATSRDILVRVIDV